MKRERKRRENKRSEKEANNVDGNAAKRMGKEETTKRTAGNGWRNNGKDERRMKGRTMERTEDGRRYNRKDRR